MQKEYPIIIFFTNAQCRHCIDFRGVDGTPKLNREWSPNFIKNIFYNSKSNPKKEDLQCSKIIEFHDTRGYGNKIQYIGEMNIYITMPHSQVITDNFFDDIMSDKNDIFGECILRVSMVYSVNGIAEFIVTIDNETKDRRCDLIKILAREYFVWRSVPEDLFLLRSYFKGKLKPGEYSNEHFNSLSHYDFFPILSRDFYTMVQSPQIYDNLLLHFYNFDWIISNFLPSKIREIERFYPTWMLILPSEWARSRDMNDKVYVKVMNCKLILKGDKYATIDSGNENISDLLKMYWRNRLFLTYEEENNLKPKSITFNA